MQIGIIGAGSIAKLYGGFWQKAGHEVMISSRTATKREAAAALVGARAGTPTEAAQFGDVVLLAVNYWTVDEAVAQIAPHVAGKLVIDATNPLAYAASGGIERVIADDEIAGLIMAQRLPQARIGKAFTTLWTGHVEQHANTADPRIAMTYAADTDTDRTTLAGLITDAGLVPVNLGTLAQSRPLDPPSPVWNVVLTQDELAARIVEFRTSASGEAA